MMRNHANAGYDKSKRIPDHTHPPPKHTSPYIISAVVILLPIFAIALLLGPQSRFVPLTRSSGQKAKLVAVAPSARFAAEPDRLDASMPKASTQTPEPIPDPIDAPDVSPAPPENESKANPPQLSVEILNVTTSVFLFPADSPTPSNPGLYPAPVDRLFLRIALDLQLESGDPIRLTFANDPSGSTDIVLKTQEGETIPVLGVVSDPPNLIGPISSGPILMTRDDASRELSLVAVVPSTTRSLECRMGSWATLSLELGPDEEPAPRSDAITGTWTKADVQAWRVRYPDRFTDLVRRDNQRRLLIDPIPNRPDQFRVRFPLCAIEGVASPLQNLQGQYWQFDLEHNGRSKTITARLIAEDSVLILYFADQPYHRFVYTR